jgi:hypothetical protein
MLRLTNRANELFLQQSAAEQRRLLHRDDRDPEAGQLGEPLSKRLSGSSFAPRVLSEALREDTRHMFLAQSQSAKLRTEKTLDLIV